MLRMTQQREIILDELIKYPGHPSADELYEKVRRRLSRISLATVYRNLEILSEAGLVTKIEISGRQKRFDHDLTLHSHVYCLECNRVDNIQGKHPLRLNLAAQDANGYKIEGYRIEFKGRCPDCQDKGEKKGEETMGCTQCQKIISEKQREVLEALATSKEPCGSKDLAHATGMEAKQVSCQLAALKKKGYIVSPVRCKYEITSDGQKVLA